MPNHRVDGANAANPNVVNLRCPHCNHHGAFHAFGNCNDIVWAEGIGNGRLVFQAGMRKCPNPSCAGLVHVVIAGGRVTESYPLEVIDFDSTNLPPGILSSLEEAIKAHAANCYRATALMVRRVLEELCDDKKAAGGDLKQRLAALGAMTLTPKELLDAADELRLLGNDAAHINAKNYDATGETEATLAIELAKELLKAVYQYTSLVDRLKALKKP
jgi:uncharacterized protein DUF4145